MYSHKRSFTGQSSRSITALVDLPFLITGVALTLVFALMHSLITYFKIKNHVRAWPPALENLSEAILYESLQKSAHIFNDNLILTTWLGLMLPLLAFSIGVRWTLEALRVSVQRTVTLVYLVTFYFCSFMIVALNQPEWTPGNRFVQLFIGLGSGFFESIRAIICLSVVGAAVYTLAKHATSKVNRSLRLVVAGLSLFALLFFDYYHSKHHRNVHESYLKSPPTARFIFILPGLSTKDVQTALRDQNLTAMREQLASFQEVHPSTPSLLGQFVTSFSGLEPNIHGIRHDFTDPALLKNTAEIVGSKTAALGHQLQAFAVGGPSPLAALLDEGTAGQRCGQTPFELSRLGHFQASVLPFALTPRLLEPWLQPYLVCSNRFLSLNQHLVQTYEKMTQELHSPGLRTFLIWISASVKSNEEKYNQVPKEYATWSNSIRMTHEVMTSHTAFLNSTGLIPFHQTFLLGLSNNSLNTTAFVRFDGQTKTKLTDLTLDSPGQRGQTSIADLLRDQQQKIEKDSPFIYSEFNDKNQSKNISTIAPEIKSNSETNRSGLEFIVSHHALRRAIVNSRRHVICQSVAASQGNARILVKVSLNVRATENRLPQLMYEEMAKSNLPNSTDSLTIQECLKNARELLTESVYRDVSLRDSSAFRTLITGLPVKSIRAASTVMDMASEVEEEAFDKSTSALPAVPNEDEE